MKALKHRFFLFLHWMQYQNHPIDIVEDHNSQDQLEVINGSSVSTNYYKSCVVHGRHYRIHTKNLNITVIFNCGMTFQATWIA